MYPRIRDLRENKNKTQAEMAKNLNIHKTTYSDYERGEVDIPTDILIELARFHQVNVDYLLGLTNINKSYPYKK